MRSDQNLEHRASFNGSLVKSATIDIKIPNHDSFDSEKFNISDSEYLLIYSNGLALFIRYSDEEFHIQSNFPLDSSYDKEKNVITVKVNL